MVTAESGLLDSISSSVLINGAEVVSSENWDDIVVELSSGEWTSAVNQA